METGNLSQKDLAGNHYNHYYHGLLSLFVVISPTTPLKIKEMKMDNKMVYQFEITLSDIEPLIWRIIEVPSE